MELGEARNLPDGCGYTAWYINNEETSSTDCAASETQPSH